MKYLFFIALFSSFVVTDSKQTLDIKIPEGNGSLKIDLNDFKVTAAKYNNDSSLYQLAAANSSKEFNLSIFIEKMDSIGDKFKCRNFYWKKAEMSPLIKENITKYETSVAAVVEHDTEYFNGQKINFHSANVYLAAGKYWIDVHISKIYCNAQDKLAISNMIKSIIISNK